MATSAHSNPGDDGNRPRAGFLVRLVRFFAWLCVTIGALVLAGMVLIYAPCFAGTPGACVSGIFLLFGAAFGLAVGGFGWLLLAFTRRRPGPARDVDPS